MKCRHTSDLKQVQNFISLKMQGPINNIKWDISDCSVNVVFLLATTIPLPFHKSYSQVKHYSVQGDSLWRGNNFISKTPWWWGWLRTAVNQPFWHGALNSPSHDAPWFHLNAFPLNSPWLIRVFLSLCVSEVIPLLTLIGKVPFVPLVESYTNHWTL